MIICVKESGPLSGIKIFESCVMDIFEWGGKFESRALEVFGGTHKDSASQRAVKCVESE